MSALDKLNAKANIVKTEDVKKKPVTHNESKNQKTTQAPKKASTFEENKNVIKEDKKESKVKVTNRHPGGRTNTRGTAGKDYKMMNIAVPIDVYEKLKEASNGNMTYYINSLLKESVKI